jgi:hypothetical protein
MPSAGGGIMDESSIPLGAGVFAFESEPFSAGDAVDKGRVLEVVDDVFDSGSFFISFLLTATGSYLARLFGDSLSVTIKDLGDFFGRALLETAGCDFGVGAMMVFDVTVGVG